MLISRSVMCIISLITYGCASICQYECISTKFDKVVK